MHPDLAGWLPHQLDHDGKRTVCRWRYVGDTPFTAPFFEDTIQQSLSRPENSRGSQVVTDLNELRAYAAKIEALAPTAFIFHVSRCGSTILSQLLSEDLAFVSLSEVGFFDQLLRARFRSALARDVNVAEDLPAAIRIFGQRRTGSERFLFIKLDSWHVGFYAELRALYADTPFILLYRHPAAVLRSHAKQPGMHAVPGLIESEVFGWNPDEISALSPRAYLPQVLGFYYDSFLRIARTDPRCLLISYEAGGVMALVQAIARFAATPLSAEHVERMKARCVFQAKNAQEVFVQTTLESPNVDCPPACLARYEELEQFRVTTKSVDI